MPESNIEIKSFDIENNQNNIYQTSNIEAEQNVIGSMLLSQDAIADICCILKYTDFLNIRHQIIYKTIVSIYEQGTPVDIVTLIDELGKINLINKIGGLIYIHKIVQLVSSTSNVIFYAEIVLEKSLLRRLNQAGSNIMKMSLESNRKAIQIIELAQNEIFKVSQHKFSEDYSIISDVVKHTINDMIISKKDNKLNNGVYTGFIELDEITHGLQNGQMIIIAARPSVGKSTFALDILRNVSIKNNIPSILFSLEMNKSEIALKLLAAESRINLQHIRKNQLNSMQWNTIRAVVKKINKTPLFIDDSATISMLEIRSKCRRLKQQQGLRLIVLDYLQLLSSKHRSESRQQEVSDLSRSLKLFAKDLQVPIIALSQLNRASEHRLDKRPLLADLRESGCISGETKILIANLNCEISIKDIYNKKEIYIKNSQVWSLSCRNNHMIYNKQVLNNVFFNGIQPVYQLVLSSGKNIKATGNHMFFVFGFGWKKLKDLDLKDLIIVPKLNDSKLIQSKRFINKGNIKLGIQPYVLKWECEKIKKISYLKKEEVFDLNISNEHNFIANNITVHNSIEQDADLVMLLHRDEIYNKNSNRLGEADLILAKNRNGPTKNLILSFQGHYSRFVNIVKDMWR